MASTRIFLAALLAATTALRAAEPPSPSYRAGADFDAPPTAPIQASGTCNFIRPLVAELEKRSNVKFLPTESPDSQTVAEDLLAGTAHLGFMSVPLAPEQKARFAAERGFAILEVKVAQDAIEILVNKANPLARITLPQLRAIFAQDASPDGRELIRDWAQLGLAPGPIIAYGGGKTWGTTRTFKKEVLGDASAFREDMKVAGMGGHGANSVEAEVGANPAAIGFTSLQTKRPDNVRVVPITVRKGSPALGTSADTLDEGSYPLQRYFYACLARPSLAAAEPGEREVLNLLLSAEGQAIVAQSESFPLSPAEVRASRAGLGLAR